jgi:HEAT repeat protein
VLRAIASLSLSFVVSLGSPAAASVWPSSHQRIATALASGDAADRRSAASRLLELPPKMARELARTALRDGDTEVRLSAAHAAASLGVEGAGDEVLAWLQDRDARLRTAACELIQAAPTNQSVQALARVLADAKPEVREAAAAAMGSSGMSETVSPLLGHLDDTSIAVRLAVVRALGRLGDDRAVVPLVSKLQDQEQDVRREAARALGLIGDKQAAATLELALQDKSLQVRVEALEALGRLRADAAVTAISAQLAAAVADPSAWSINQSELATREAALVALGRIATPGAIKVLIDELEKEGAVPYDSSSRAPVRRALTLAAAAGEQALIDVLAGAPSQVLASAAAFALGDLAAASPATTSAASASQAIVRAAQRGTVELNAALASLRRTGDKSALPFVLEHVDHADAGVRESVVAVAIALADPRDQDGRAVDVVRERVLDLGAPVGERASLVRLLGRTGSPRALELVLSLTPPKRAGEPKRPESSVLRTAVVEALGELAVESPQVDEQLLDAIGHSSERLRMAAAKSLAKVASDKATKELIVRLGTSAEQDRAALGLAVSGALGRSRDPELVKQAATALRTLSGRSRDALIEGLGRMRIVDATQLLGELKKSTDADDRRKVAEALAGQSGGEAVAVALLADADPTVRASAAWSLVRVGGEKSLGAVTRALGDSDVAVAGNAAVALAEIAKRANKPAPAAAALCGALEDYRSYVRASALFGLTTLTSNCPGGGIRRLLTTDPSWRVRSAASDALQAAAPPVPSNPGTPADAPRVAATPNDGAAPTAKPTPPPVDPAVEAALDRRALVRCAIEDRDASVAARCAAGPRPRSTTPNTRTHDVLVYVVPDGATAPLARAPFALVLPTGALRLGVADRRGALFEIAAPAGTIELAVPAALAP